MYTFIVSENLTVPHQLHMVVKMKIEHMVILVIIRRKLLLHKINKENRKQYEEVNNP